MESGIRRNETTKLESFRLSVTPHLKPKQHQPTRFLEDTEPRNIFPQLKGQQRKMRLLTHNTLRNNSKEAAGKGYPLRINAVEVKVVDNAGELTEREISFVKHMLPTLEWSALVKVSCRCSNAYLVIIWYMDLPIFFVSINLAYETLWPFRTRLFDLNRGQQNLEFLPYPTRWQRIWQRILRFCKPCIIY